MTISNISDCTILSNGVGMPWLGLGVWQSTDGVEVENAVLWALEAGYRSIDTAAIYGNEGGVGNALKSSPIPREEVFITTKVWNSDQGYQSTLAALDLSLKKLKTDYVDLYLVHWPVKGQYIETWQAMEAIYDQGKARAIGVSNFMVHHLKDLIQNCQILPMVNQVEFHPYLIQPHLLEFCQRQQIQLEAWGPLMKGNFEEVKELGLLAEKYNKSPSQILVRWDLQQGVVTIPKSVKLSRIQSNADIFDFELDAEDMTMLNALDKEYRFGPDPDNFNF